jgi:hypothetical protein
MNRLKPIARDGFTVGGEQHGVNRARTTMISNIASPWPYDTAAFRWLALALRAGHGSSRARDAKFTGAQLNFLHRVV